MPTQFPFDPSIHAARRARFAEHMPAGSVAIFPSARVAARNNDVDHDFRQNSDLFYLTGFDEPEATALLFKDEEGARFEMIVRPKDKLREIWDGYRSGVEGAKTDYAAHDAHATTDRDDVLLKSLKGRHTLYYALGEHGDLDPLILKMLATFRRQKRANQSGPSLVKDPGPVLHEMRLIKSKEEIARLQAAADITVEAHNAAMRALKPGMNERQIQAIVEGTFRALGSERNGYPCIIAGGANATVLHYNTNNQPVPAGGLLLIDAGAERDYYTADVTRTFPADGRFSDAQKAVYNVVLEAQLASIAASTTSTTFDGVHDVSVRVLTEGLIRIGLLTGDVESLIEQGAYKRFYMHRTGHWLGMDVHDVGDYTQGGQSRLLEPGMVMTIEPGIYIAPDDMEVPEAFRGIGVRIEDNVLITTGAPIVLTDACPKEVEAIEAMMAESPRPLPVG